MAELFLTRATLRPEAAADPRLWQRLADGYGLHQLIWQWFAAEPGSPREFLYRIDPGPATAGPIVYALSARTPVDGAGSFDFHVKNYAPKLAAGDWLEFDVRASPTRVKARAPGGEKHGKRVDVVMDSKHAESELPAAERTPEAVLVQAAGSAWLLAKQAALGVTIEEKSLLVGGYRQHRLHHGAKSGAIQFSTIDVSGRLQVMDPERFLGAIRAGLGPQKAFGCGLWLLRRAL